MLDVSNASVSDPPVTDKPPPPIASTTSAICEPLDTTTVTPDQHATVLEVGTPALQLPGSSQADETASQADETAPVNSSVHAGNAAARATQPSDATAAAATARMPANCRTALTA